MAEAERHPHRPHFGVGFRGYDRAQVDTFVAESANWSSQAWVRINQLEARVFELEADPDALGRARDEAERTVQDAREKVELFVEQVDAKGVAVERALVNGAKPHLDELRRSLEYLEQERSSRRAELNRLRESLGGLADGVPVVKDHESGDAEASGHTSEVQVAFEAGAASEVSSTVPEAAVRQARNQ